MFRLFSLSLYFFFLENIGRMSDHQKPYRYRSKPFTQHAEEGAESGDRQASGEEGADEEEDGKKRTESPLLIHLKHFSEDALVRRRSVL